MTDSQPASEVSPAAPPPTPAGWYADASMAGTQRYWDGTAWTDHVAPVAPVPEAKKGTVRIVLGAVFAFFALIAVLLAVGAHAWIWMALIWALLSIAAFVGGFGARNGTRT